MWGYDDKESIDTNKKNIDQSVQELLTILISQSGRGKACEVGGPGPPPPLDTPHCPCVITIFSDSYPCDNDAYIIRIYIFYNCPCVIIIYS